MSSVEIKSLPKGWEWKTLGELTIILTKGTTPTSVGYKFEDEGINYIKVESINLNGSFIKEKFAHISIEAHNSLKRSQLVEGDILFSIAGALGRSAIVTSDILPANTNQALSIIRLKANNRILKEYILLALTSGYALEQVKKYKGGVAQQNLSLTQMKSFQIPIPPLAEQQKIVTLLDQAFADIQQAQANIEQNIVNAKELFQSKLNEIFSQRGDGWEEKRLGEVCNLKSGKTIKKSLEKTDGGVLYIKVGDMNIEGNEEYITTSTRFVNSSDVSEKSVLDKGAIIFPKRGGAIATNKKRRIIKPTIVDLNTMALVPTEMVISDYLYHWFSTIDLASLSNGTSVPQINNYSFDEVYIPFPHSHKEQEDISNLFSEILKEVKYLENHYQQKLDNLEELKKSLLEKAFSGALTRDSMTAS